MITSGSVQLDAMFSALEETILNVVESNAVKAGEIATLKERVRELEAKLSQTDAKAAEPTELSS